MDPVTIIFLIIAEIIIIFITTLIGEWYLKKFKPIDQI
jgi:hypothetical protein